MEYNIAVSPQKERKVADTRSVPFGLQPTEHMFITEYANGEWQSPRIVPFENLVLSPLTLSLHYGQTVFEGMKAFYMADGKINIFRPEKHYNRFCQSLERMCMPKVPKALFMEALHQFVQLETDWIPQEDDGSLYLRPFMIASEARLGVKVSDEYIFMICATPAYAYYSKPLTVKVETKYVRAAEGGTGAAKCGGNYGASFYPFQKAKEEGYDQILWTDAKTHQLIEESGTMNIMFYIDGTLITPALSGTILDGVTRDSLLTMAKENGVKTEERQVSWKELQDAFEAGKRVEAFGAGTAAVIAPIETLAIGDKQYQCYIGDDAMMYQLRDALYRVRKGIDKDSHGWNYVL
ncbi:branched-chain amino acid aminotransferase [Taibaiella soli]|uniref:branched-chain-amino-acid transaminase n=1 Tax=Taibaiella soli TaxID=1649169 RepID=A0A2W2BBB0_9BACT|nr:branched-chain amino acid aminotransferase [Taibaiella soli]PZF70926.1 branched chain amino acid aminotransferase [Taibaiella soli]